MTKQKTNRSFARKVLACVCSVALGSALVPAFAIQALADSTEAPALTLSTYNKTTDETAQIASYTSEELAALASADTFNYLTGAANGTVYETSKLVTAETLLGSIDAWGPGASLTFYTPNKAGTAIEEYTKAHPTYEEVTAARHYFPNYSYESIDAETNAKSGEDKSVEGKVAVPAGLALELDSAKLSAGSQKASEALNNVETDNSCPRWMMGATEDEYVASGPLGGKLTPSGVTSITVVYEASEPTQPSDEPAVEPKAQTITGAKASYAKTYGDKAFSLGAKAATALSYKSSNAKVAAVDAAGKVTVKGAGKATITITAAANAEYKAATKSVSVTVAKAKNTMTVKAKTVKAKAKKKTTTKATKAFSVKKAIGKVTYAKKSGNKKVSVAKSGKVTVKKGLKKGKTYKVKVKVTAKGNANYKSLTKTVTLKVKVK